MHKYYFTFIVFVRKGLLKHCLEVRPLSPAFPEPLMSIVYCYSYALSICQCVKVYFMLQWRGIVWQRASCVIHDNKMATITYNAESAI